MVILELSNCLIGGPRKQRGSRNKVTLAVEALLDGEAEALTRKAVELAMGGDMQALRLRTTRELLSDALLGGGRARQ